jgi:hypothetical protein
MGNSTVSSNGKGYERTGSETSYATGRTQTLETAMPGVLEDISIAVSIDKAFLPPTMHTDELKGLIARAANPRVQPGNVSVIVTDFSQPDGFNDKVTSSGSKAPGADGQDDATATDLPPRAGTENTAIMTWLLWGGMGVLLIALLATAVLLTQGRKGDHETLATTRQELDQLREMAFEQQQQIKTAQAQANMAVQSQQQQQQAQAERQQATQNLKETLSELQQVFSQSDPAVLSQQVQQWMNNG